MRQEKVFVGIIVVSFYLKLLGLRSAFHLNVFGFSFLLGKDTGHRQAAKLKLRLQPE